MNKKELTEKQESFLDNLMKTGGDPKKAAELAGYAEGGYHQVIKSLKNEIIDMASHVLAQSAPQAAMKMVNIMNSNEPVPQANMRLQAAQSILDRIGLSKTDRIDVTHKTDQGLFILPAKKETVIDGDYEEAQG